MADYTLTLTAAEIDIALNRVNNPDLVPLLNSGELVTSGGVKNYVDTQIGAIPEPPALIGVNTSVSSSGISGNAGGPPYTSPTISSPVVVGNSVDLDTHKLSRINYYTLRAPSQGASIIYVKAGIYDQDTTSGDYFIVYLYINGTLEASVSSYSDANNNTWLYLQYSNYVPPNATIALNVAGGSGAIYAAYTGTIVCVNYQ